MSIQQHVGHPLTWFKSSYSGGSGGDCVEVAVNWTKSSYSGSDGGDCVEVATCPSAIHIRDSKDPDGGTLTVSPEAWASFVEFARGL
ncbi:MULTISPECIES: DUF397 domain-containing protein [Streptomycetaceae]|uniref:DUF397 domain-containing protein n=1 Tax=Streptantibioticus cattleyicolor (strain ATCC 35852 / DSM 46488 / JCM 4925 / NBRC 14057 / NRRL 8057) TaxID=1003195 RepID=F8JSL3_STREN|nr:MULTISPECIES: DUF397 domain-containing protein [Streptomycetaceae]AEW96742.1 hypothetical protein SCATT_43710 [Streptantibioticus cattleyicolor NRRL 8057 = DSM 46488]MYS61228.1 DUF397 domain-containing protein [Streptomyces sp. SID5468]CCB77077.1 conserved protein of unknown function [Streptantibioticus cattleyicolor NRRL 8057 = DSM 46488]